MAVGGCKIQMAFCGYMFSPASTDRPSLQLLLPTPFPHPPWLLQSPLALRSQLHVLRLKPILTPYTSSRQPPEPQTSSTITKPATISKAAPDLHHQTQPPHRPPTPNTLRTFPPASSTTTKPAAWSQIFSRYVAAGKRMNTRAWSPRASSPYLTWRSHTFEI